MGGFKQWQGPLLAGLIWSVVALASVRLRDAGVVLLVWLPSAVSVAALFGTPQGRRVRLLGVMAVFQFAALLAILGAPLGALGYTLASQAETIVCGAVGIKVLGSRKGSPRTLKHVVGLFAGALLGSAAGALIALPFHPVGSAAELAWRFCATVLGVLAGTPAMLLMRQRAGFGDQSVAIFGYETKPYFALTLAGLLALGVIVLSIPAAGLMPVLLVAIVFAVIRYGPMAAACGVLAYIAAGTLVSVWASTPVLGWSLDAFTAGLALQAQLLLMLASTLPIAAMLFSRQQLQSTLREQNRRLRENVTILSLAESLAGIGRWRYDMRSGAQEWSPAMLALNGLPAEFAKDPGNVRGLLPNNGAELFGRLASHRGAREPYGFDYTIAPPSGGERILRIKVKNEFDDADERVALFAVAMDVTDQVRREDALRSAREQAVMLAAESQMLANTDPLTGLANRRATFDWLGRLVAAAMETGDPLSLVMFDIDHFKRVNDCFGHATGDEVLKKVARVARSVMRGDDVVGRIGGEEFVCLLPGLDGHKARALAERLRRAVAEGKAADGLPVATISLGLALLRPGDTGASLLERADAALYEAKGAGRNQVRRAA